MSKSRIMYRAKRIAGRVVATLLETIDAKSLPTLWYENEAGDKYVPPLDGEMPPEIPEGFEYQHSRFPTILREDVLRTKPEGDGCEQVCAMNSGWQPDLVLALTRKGMTLSEAIIVSATACERCMNVLADECGLSWGYAWGSEEWRKSNTVCDFCREGPRAE